MSLLLYSHDNWSLCVVASLWISYHNNDLCKELKNLFRATDKNINKPRASFNDSDYSNKHGALIIKWIHKNDGCNYLSMASVWINYIRLQE